jgi:hypothetical protein
MVRDMVKGGFPDGRLGAADGSATQMASEWPRNKNSFDKNYE